MPKILFIGTEDDVTLHYKFYFRYLIKKGGFQLAKTAWGWEDVHNRARQENPDLVIVHFGLTDTRRDEAQKEMLQFKRETRAKIMVISASRILFEEADLCIPLPPSWNGLLRAVKKVLK